MRKLCMVLLALVVVVCFAVALSYPIRYRIADQRTAEVQERLIAMRDAALEGAQNPTDGESGPPPEAAAESGAPDAQDSAKVGEAQVKDASNASFAAENGLTTAPETDILEDRVPQEESGDAAPESVPMPAPVTTAAPSPTVDRHRREGAEAYPNLEKRTLDVEKILPQYQTIYAINSDLVGWITIPGTDIDYPVVQAKDSEASEFYLHHDFFGDENDNGQIILDPLCDPYTPSYNLIISGHNMRSDKMFGTLDEYRSKSYWQAHKIVYFDTLMEQGEYVVFAAFYSADFDVDETGFRYNTDIQYRVDADQWIAEVRANQLYDAGIDVEFGDHFLTLTTCNKAKRQDGRFVVVCRKIREGEEIT